MANKSNTELLNDRIIVLKEQYRKNLIQKTKTLSNIWNDIKQQKHVSKNLKELFLLLHNLSGTGTTFGFMQVSEQAKYLGFVVKAFQGDEVTLNSEQLNQLDILVQALLVGLANPIDESYLLNNRILSSAKSDNRLIYIVDDDQFFSDELSIQLTNSGYKVQVFSKPQDVFKQNSKDKPALILMDMVFADAEFEGARTVAQYRNEVDSNVPVIFVSVCDDLESRLQALRSGCDYYLLKPLDYDHLFNVLNHVLDSNGKSPFRVLIIDDDEIIITYYKMVLNEAGMLAEGITNPQQALGFIKDFEPEIILMDVNMPYCNGIELANIIRQYPKWISIPILFLTTETNYNIRNSAFDLGADEYILKPVSPQQLIRIVTTRAMRARQLKDISNELIENKNRTNNIMETLHDVIWSADSTNWMLTYISTSCESVVGISSDILKHSKDWRNFVHPEDRDFVNAEIDKLDQKSSIEVVYRLNKPDGTKRWVLENIQKIKNENSNSYRYDGIIHDITNQEIDKQHIKRRLAVESELALFTRSLLQHNDLDLAFDCLLKIADANVIQIFHTQSEDLRNENYVSLFNIGNSKYINQVETNLNESRLTTHLKKLKSGTHQFVRGLHPRYSEKHDNLLIPIYVQKYWFGFISFILPENHPYHTDDELSILKSATEILSNFFEKERNIAEKLGQDKLLDTTGKISRTLLMESDYNEALSSSLRYLGEVVKYNELYLLKLADNGNDFQLYSHSVLDTIFTSQSSFMRIWDCIFNKFKDPILGKQSLLLDKPKFNDVFPNQDLDIKHFVIVPIAHSRSLWGVMVLVTNKSGNHIKKQHLPILESIADSFGGALIRLQTQNELIEAKNQSELANRSKSEFLANMSHEIRTPMNAILGFAQLMKNNKLDEERDEFVDLILDSGNKLLSLITDVMDLSNVEIGKTHINKSEIELPTLVDLIIKQNSSSIRKKKLHIEIEIQDNLPAIISDADKISKVIDCLLSNAIKFTENGKISLKLNINFVEPGVNNLVIEVRDTGIGIPLNKQKIIFNAFEQADSSKTRRYSGIGLGLTLTSRIIRILNGTIELYSTEGQGSTFILAIPVELPENAGTPKIAVTKIKNAEKIKILAAEDNKINRILLTKVFEKTGYLLHTVENGAEAVEYLINNPDIRLVLMDIHMPVMSGTEATLSIKSNPITKHIPVIALTASVLQEDINICFEAGMDDFLEKPLQTDHLFSVINKWCI